MEKFLAAEGHVSAESLPVNECFGCGPGNSAGMQLKFFYEEGKAVCDFKLTKSFEGPPGHCHGGIIATILDEAMGKVNKLRDVVALTKSMEIDYMRPVPLYTELRAVGWEEKVQGRVHINAGEIRNLAGEVLAKSHGVFIVVDHEQMFAEEIKGK